MENITFRKKAVSHFKRHKGKYVTGGVFLMVFGGTIGLFLSSNNKTYISPNAFEVLKRKDLSPKELLYPISNDDVVANSRSLINYIGRNGHPGNVIYCNETKQLFKSHREASRELGIDKRELWSYLKGKKPSAKGFTFRRIGEAKTSVVS